MHLQVLHPISMMPAIKSKIPVRVKNSYNPSATGTVISDQRSEPLPLLSSPLHHLDFPFISRRDKSMTLVTAITSKSNVQLVDIYSTRMLGQYGFLSKVCLLFAPRADLTLTVTLQVFSIFEACKISVDVVASSDVSLSLTLDNKQSKSGNIQQLLVKESTPSLLPFLACSLEVSNRLTGGAADRGRGNRLGGSSHSVSHIESRESL